MLFVLLFQILAIGKLVEFGNMQTSGAAILVHAIICLGLITIFLISIVAHLYTSIAFLVYILGAYLWYTKHTFYQN